MNRHEACIQLAMAIETYRDLDTWQACMTAVEQTYLVTRQFPIEERFGLTSQARRAAVSMPSNVVEGWCRRSTGTYINHVSIALGSHGELETCLEIGRRLKYLAQSDFDASMQAVDRAGQLLNGLLRSLEAKDR
jgi:four helix bundle protein